MEYVVLDSLSELNETQALVDKKLPTYRQAYSDRTCWLMACCSELAYLRFNPLFKDVSQEYFIQKVVELSGRSDLTSLKWLIGELAYDETKELEKLKDNALLLNFGLIETFDVQGTQAILLGSEDHLVLAFRGTEPSSIRDIVTDAKASTTISPSGGRVHLGFNEAFNHVAIDIQRTLQRPDLQGRSLFITGHSLGGALATIATKELIHPAGMAACYNFGSPRVGDMRWGEGIKTPIYRVVNAADPVTMLPPGAELVGLLAWAVGFVPYVGKPVKAFLLEKFKGYMHVGDMRYLSNVPAGDYGKVELFYAVSFFFRIKAYLMKKLPFIKMPKDNSIAIYRRKLRVIAVRRNGL